MDPLARQSVTADGFAAITRGMMRVAGELVHGRLVYLQEGCVALPGLVTEPRPG